MHVLSVHAFHGPNSYCHLPVTEILVDCRSWQEPSDLSGLARQLGQWLPGICLDAASRLEPIDLLKELVVALQAAVGVAKDFGETSATAQPGVHQMVLAFEEESLLRECLDVGLKMLAAADTGAEFDAAAEIRRLQDLADNVRLGPSSRAIVRAADARGIPWRRLNNGSLVQLGEGKHQRRTWTAETDATSAVAESIASDKELTKRLLRAVGVPVPRGRPVVSAGDAWDAAREIGLPVAVKPRNANHARGISLDLSLPEQFGPAFDFAVEDGNDSGVMVEQFARGNAHRLLVVGNRMVAAARGESEHVVGDGVHTIRELVDEVNRDPRRGENYSDLLNVLKLDGGALIELKKQGLTVESIPAAGQRVLVQPVGDLTTDVTARVHPRNAEHAVLAAKAVGLDIAGIDLVAEDIGRPLEEQRGMILEVNAGPSLSMHIAPLHGEPQPVGEAIVDLLFEPDTSGRVAIVAVAGGGDRATMVARVERLWREAGIQCGAATGEGIRIGGRLVLSDAATDFDRARAMLLHPGVEAAVFESQPEEAAARGLGCGRCDVVIVVAEAGEAAASTIDGIVAAVRAVPPEGTVLLDAPLLSCERLRNACRGRALELSAETLREAISAPRGARRSAAETAGVL